MSRAAPSASARNFARRPTSAVILKALLNMDIDVEALPMGSEELSPAGIETVVLAEPVPTRGRLLDDMEVKTEDQEDNGIVVLE